MATWPHNMQDGGSNLAGSPPPADSPDRLVRKLGARYLVVLAMVALLMVLDQSVLQPLLVRLDAYAPAINLSGRQRMLSQKLSKSALALQSSDEEAELDAHRIELRDTLRQWSRAHEALLHGDSQHAIRRIDSPEIAAEWRVLQPDFDAMSAAALRLSTISGAPETTENAIDAAQATREIMAHEGTYLTAMDRIVNLMEAQAAREITRLRACALAIACVVVLLLLGLGWFVVRPATRTIRRQVDDLESRVARRTRELSDALVALRHEVKERETLESKNKTLAARLGHADRVASMGHLTIGLAHELNQPLGAIANYAEACDVMLSRPSDDRRQVSLQENVGHIKQASLRAGRIVRSIRNFVQPSPGTIVDANINVLVEEVVALCRQELLKANTSLTLDLAAENGIVAVDPIQIQQVLVNLVQNGLQAMRGCPNELRRLTIRTSCNFDTVQVDLLDQGMGLTAAEAETIFKPFHTTKEDGLGIGLAICRSIIDAYEGSIWAESTPGQGAQISFTLPTVLLHDTDRPLEANFVCR